MLRFIMFIVIIALSIALFTGEPKAAPPKAAPAQVECHGKLRTSQVNITANSPGTTVTFDGIIWELKLPDEAACKFASQHHKKPVTVVGTIRRVEAGAKDPKWVVDVTQLKERDEKAVHDGGTMTVQGTLKNEPPTPGAAPQLSVVADGITWPLDATENAALQEKAESLTKKTVLVKGKVGHLAERAYPPKMKISVDKLESAPTTTALLR